MTNANVRTDIPPATQPKRGWHIPHHVHIGANTLSILMGVAMGIWAWVMFWGVEGEPSLVTVSSVITIYLIIEPITAALSVFRKDRWLMGVLDILAAFALVIECALMVYDNKALGITGIRFQAASLLTTAALGALISGLLITLVANTRVFAGSAN